jgi:hypothetical protein
MMNGSSEGKVTFWLGVLFEDMSLISLVGVFQKRLDTARAYPDFIGLGKQKNFSYLDFTGGGQVHSWYLLSMRSMLKFITVVSLD